MITSLPTYGMSINHNFPKNKPLPWYSPSRDPSENSYFSLPRIDANREPPVKENIQMKHRHLRHPSPENGEIPALNFFQKDLKYHHTVDDKDPIPNVVKRDPKYKVYKNPDDDDPDLNFYKKNSKFQTVEDSNDEDLDMNYSKKDSERRAILSQFEKEQNDEYLKYPVQPYPPNVEDYYDSEAPEDNKIEYQTTPAEDDDDYIEEEEEEAIAKPQKMKREELTPLMYKQIAESMDKELEGMIGGSNPCSNCSAIKLENDYLKALKDNETARYEGQRTYKRLVAGGERFFLYCECQEILRNQN